MWLGLPLILTFLIFNSAFAAEFEVGGDYSRAPEGLVIRGRSIPVKFGAAIVGFKTDLSPVSTISFKLGKGYDPSVNRTFLDVDSNGPASCEMFIVETERRFKKIENLEISGGGSFKYQQVHAKLSGNRNGGPFAGTADIGSRSVELHLKVNYPVSDTTALYGQAGLQLWRYNFEAFGSMERVRVWTDSAERGVSPRFAFGGLRKFGDTTVSSELNAYSMRSDNKTWVPGVTVKVSRNW